MACYEIRVLQLDPLLPGLFMHGLLPGWIVKPVAMRIILAMHLSPPGP